MDHKARFFYTTAFATIMGLVCYYTIDHPSHVLRLGVAGSISGMTTECAFHVVDTVNIRSKVGENVNKGLME
jgi:hypothetical protein